MYGLPQWRLGAHGQAVREYLLMPAQGQAACWGVAPRGPTPVLPSGCSQSDGGRQCSVNPVDSMGAEGTETCGHKKSRADPKHPLPVTYGASGRHAGPGLWSRWPQPRPGVPE